MTYGNGSSRVTSSQVPMNGASRPGAQGTAQPSGGNLVPLGQAPGGQPLGGHPPGGQASEQPKEIVPVGAELPFDQPVILRRAPFWSRSLIYVLTGVTAFAVGWAFIAKVEEAIPAQGKLEPKGAVQEVKARVGGVVAELLVKDGDDVTAGQPLVRFEASTSQAQLLSLQQVRDALLAENQFYQAQLGQAQGTAATRPVNIPPSLLSLTENRVALIAETQLYRAQLGQLSTANLSPEQLARLQTNVAERTTREAAAQLEISQLTQQFNQAQSRFFNTQSQLATAQAQLVKTQDQLVDSRQRLTVESKILTDIQPLAEEGGIAKVQFLRQQQEVNRGRSDVSRQEADLLARQAEVVKQQSELQQLQQEQQRLQLAIAQAQQQFQNTQARSSQDPLGQIAENEKRLAEIDSQLTKVILDNKKRIEELNAQISQAQQTIDYQVLTAPVAGKVFDLQPKGSGHVVQTSEPVLKIVPESANLVANVFITNRDIGFVRQDMDVDVRIDSFPYSEFGDIKGKLVKVGSDALPPDQIHQYYRFPAEVSLNSQMLQVEGKNIDLQSGMSVSVNIKTRPRRVITYFIDLFSKKIDSFTSRQ